MSNFSIPDPITIDEAKGALEFYDEDGFLDNNDLQRVIPLVRWALTAGIPHCQERRATEEPLTGEAGAPTRYCKTHGVTTQFKQFDRCIQYEIDQTPCRFVWVALVELGDSE